MTNLPLEDYLVQDILAISSAWEKTPSEFIDHLLSAFGAACWLGVFPKPPKRRKCK